MSTPRKTAEETGIEEIVGGLQALRVDDSLTVWASGGDDHSYLWCNTMLAKVTAAWEEAFGFSFAKCFQPHVVQDHGTKLWTLRLTRTHIPGEVE
jgi:hypothetical protein